MLEVQDIWKLAACELKELLDADTYQRWILNIVPVRLDCSDIVLGVPGGTFREWLSINFKGLIEDAILKTSSLKLNAVFETGYKVAECKHPETAETSAEDGKASEAVVSANTSKQTKKAKVSDTAEKDDEQGSIVLDRRFRFDSSFTIIYTLTCNLATAI